jgi:hypothetical protein
MNSTSSEGQDNQAQEKQGGISQGINTINNFVGRGGIKNPLAGSRIAVAGQTAARSFSMWLAANPGIWIPVLLIVFLFIFTFLVVGLVGAPPPSQNPTQ